MKRIAVVALTILCCTVGHAREFNVELGGTLSGEDFGDAFDADFYALDARYYFHAVSDSDGPYREAAFIDPSSSIAVSYSGADFDSTDNDTESDDWQLRGRYYNRAHGWYVSAGLGRGESETRVGPEVRIAALDPPVTPVFGVIVGGTVAPPGPITSKTDADAENYTLGLGHYFGPRTTLDLSYTRSEIDADTRSIACFDDFFGFGSTLDDFSSTLQCFLEPFITRETETDSLQLTVKHLREIAYIHLALHGSIGYLKSSTETELLFTDNVVVGDPGIPIIFGSADPIAFDPFTFTGAVDILRPTSFTDEGWNTAVDIALYPRRNLGITIAYDYADIEDNQTKTYSAALEWFLTRSFAVSLSYTDIDFDNNLGNADSVALRLSGRF